MKKSFRIISKLTLKIFTLFLSLIMVFSVANSTPIYASASLANEEEMVSNGQNDTLLSIDNNLNTIDLVIDKQITLDFQGGIKGNGDQEQSSETIFARDYDTVFLDVPTRQGYAFYGYFSAPNACGDKFYDYRGKRLDSVSLNNSSPDKLYAAWVKTSSMVNYTGDKIRIDEANGKRYTPYEKVGLDALRLAEIGYTKIEINMDVEIRAQDKGEGRNMWFDLLTDGKSTYNQNLLENADLQNTEWENTYASAIVDITKFNKASEFRFGFEQTNTYFWTKAIWWANNPVCYFTATGKKPLKPMSSEYELLQTDSYNLEDNSGYNISNIEPSTNPLGGNYANIGLKVKGGNIIKGDIKDGVQQYGYTISDTYSGAGETSINLLLDYNYNTKEKINDTAWQISEDSYCSEINGIKGVGVVQTGAVLVQKLKVGGNPDEPSDWAWENPVNSGITQSFHTADFVDSFSPEEYDGNPHFVKRVIPVIKRDAEGNYVYKYDEYDTTKIVGVEYEKDSNDNYCFQDIYEDIDGYAPIYSFNGKELESTGVTIRVLFCYELKRNIGNKWQYTNICEETTFSLYPSNAKILLQNMDFTSYSEGETQESDAGSSELIRKFGTVKDGNSVNDGFQVNFNGNETYTVEYYKNNATNENEKKYAYDGQIFREPGKYRFVVTPKVGEACETTIYINEKGIQNNLEKYFGDGFITSDSHRVFSQTDAIPVYLANKTYWSTLQYNSFSSPLVGRIGIAIGKQTEFWEKRTDNDDDPFNDPYYVRYIKYNGQILYENLDYFRLDYGNETLFFKILEYVDASDGLPKKNILTEVGEYYCEFATNKDFFNNYANLSGDVYTFVFQFKITDKPQKPSINEQLFNNNLSFVDYNSLFYAVDLPTNTENSVTYAFNNASNAYDFAYNYQRSLVKVSLDKYLYLGETYATQAEVLAKVQATAKASICKRYFDANDADSFLTTQGNVHCEIDKNGKAELQIREAIKDEGNNISGYNITGKVKLTKSVVVFGDSFSVNDYVIGDPFLNDKPYTYLNENGDVVSGYNSIRFVQAADYESAFVKLTHIESGLNWVIPYGVPVQEFLVDKKAPSGRYKITESNLDAVSEYFGVYIAPGDNTTVLNITRVNGQNQFTQVLSQASANIRFENINALIINSATNRLDPYGIIKIVNMSSNETVTLRLDEVVDYKIEEQGHYAIHTIDRLGNTAVYYADIYDATKFYDLTFVNEEEILNVNTVGGGTRVNLPKLSSSNSLVEFVGWQDENGKIITEDYIYYGYSSNTTLTAVWYFKGTSIQLYDGKLLKEYQTKPDAFIKLEDLYGVTKDGLTYFRYVYEDSSGVKHFYLPEIQAVPNVQSMRLDTLWKDSNNPITATSGDALSIPTKTGYRFFGYILDDETLFFDKVDINTDSSLTLYALYMVDPVYTATNSVGVMGSLSNFVGGTTAFVGSLMQNYGVQIGCGFFALMIVVAIGLLHKYKNSYAYGKLSTAASGLNSRAMAKNEFAYATVNTVQNTVENKDEKKLKRVNKHSIKFSRFTYRKFVIPIVCLFMAVVFLFVSNEKGLFSIKIAAEMRAQEIAIEREVESYKEKVARENNERKQYVNRTSLAYKATDKLNALDLYEERVDTAIYSSADIDFLNNLVGLNLEDLDYSVFKTKISVGSKNVEGWLYTQGTFNKEYNAYLAGFVAFADEGEIDYWLIDGSVVELGGVQYVFVYNETINTMHYIAHNKYVYYSVDDYEICFDIVDYSVEAINYNYGYLYNYDKFCAEYDPDLGKNIDLSAFSTLRGIDYNFAIDYYTSVIANQDQYAVSLDSVTITAIDVAALNEAILNGQEESFLGISSEQIYEIESKLSSVSFYYIDGETGCIQTLDTQDILDRYYAEAHKDDVTFLQVLNWILIGAQIIGGIILCCVPGGQLNGALLLAGGIMGIISECCGPQIQEIIGGIGVTANGISAITIGVQLLFKGPVGIAAGLVCIGIGAGTAFFGINDITEGIWGDNLIKDVWGMSEEAYQWTELGLNIASTVCTIGGKMLKSKLSKKPEVKMPDMPDDAVQPKPTAPGDTPSATTKPTTPSEATSGVSKLKGTQNPTVKKAAAQGRAAHTNARGMQEGFSDVYKVPSSQTEVKISSSCRVDAIDYNNSTIFELKPNNPKAIARGVKQLQRYINAAGSGFKGQIVVYDIDSNGKFVYTILSEIIKGGV